MKKETYEEPKMEVVEFETEDIITASNKPGIVLPDDEFYSL